MAKITVLVIIFSVRQTKNLAKVYKARDSGADLGFKEGGFELTTPKAEAVRGSPQKILKLGPRKCDFQRFEMKEEDVYFRKIHLNFVLASKNNKKKETKREFARRSWG